MAMPADRTTASICTSPEDGMEKNHQIPMQRQQHISEILRVDTDHAVQFISNEGRAITDTVLDGILTREKDAENKDGKMTFFICDAVRCNGQDITKMSVFQHIAFVKENVMEPRLDAVDEHQTISIKNEVFNLDIVECLDCNSADFLDTEFENGFKYPLHSFVFFTRNQKYVGGSCKNVLRWREDENYDCVFRIVIQKGSNGTDTAGLQAVGPYNQEIYFASIDMTDVIQQLDHRIVDCRFVNGQWDLVIIRNDRSHPDSRRAIINKMNMLKNPVTREILKTSLDKSKGKIQ
ncbi:mRNA-capping enzyme-like [Daphnia pulex]|uniref:mRNA-capping enzyme-like n=1 Tax=Daphnia pulex TaxID=6669 RepID=UPI001EDE97EB|nr:mRNA-capping enzyme-like [Daphnia pulex]XP_046445998.1 mRNA-capping enzyme-like [Daphnia pulex]